MVGVSYSVIGILAIVIHCTINRDTMFYHKNSENSENLTFYRRFLWGILAYFITDSLWGILDALKLIDAIKIDTFLYYIAMSVAVVLWCDYVVAYLYQRNKFGKWLRLFGRIFVLFELGALVLNIFKPFFFWFDTDGLYHAGPIRYVALYIQIAMFGLSTVQATFITIRTTGIRRRRHLAICLFGYAMIIAIIEQIFYPMLPIYTIGYLIGVCFLHVFVEEDEKDEQMRNMQKQMGIISSMAGIFFCSYYIDMESKNYTEVDNKIPENDNVIPRNGNAVEILNKMCEHLVLPQYKKEMLKFTNLDTLDERISEKKYYVSMQFESVHLGWAEGYFIASDRDENGKLKHVLWAIRTINDEKAREEKLFYNSYIDELTGLYNRKMYNEDTIENLSKFMKDDLIYISMDVNGLKGVNDSKGHSAGDELIAGAAACMKKAMGEYGKIYRTGGDEFIALLNADSNELKKIKENFEKYTTDYKGTYIESISVSCGYVLRCENMNLSLAEIEILADKNMYLAKRAHYAANGTDRRDQQNAYKALCAIYTKILMVNLTEDKYSIVSMDKNEQTEDKGFSTGIFEWLEKFATSGQVHPDDREEYLSKTNREFLTNYFKQDKTSISILYRRMTNGEFKLSEMEMIPSENYSDDNQNLYLYVKEIDK